MDIDGVVHCSSSVPFEPTQVGSQVLTHLLLSQKNGSNLSPAREGWEKNRNKINKDN